MQPTRRRTTVPCFALLLWTLVLTKSFAPLLAEDIRFYHGDPIALVEGTRQNEQSFFEKQTLYHFKGYRRVNLRVWLEESTIAESNTLADSEAAAVSFTDPPNTERQGGGSLEALLREQVYLYQFYAEQNLFRPPTFIYRSPSKDYLGIQLYFEISEHDPELLVLTGVRFESHPFLPDIVYTARALHYSIRPDKSAFSILFYLNEESPGFDRAVVLVTFTKPDERLSSFVERESSEFNFVEGKGVRVRWQKNPIVLQYCSHDPLLYERLGFAIEHWNQALANLRKVILVTGPDLCPPIGDVNTHGFYVVDDYAISPPHWSTRGTAASHFFSNLRNLEIVDSDIFVYRQELPTLLYDEYANRALGFTMLHELGHFLGLGHQFERVSVMSYGNYPAAVGLTNYDIDAIQALYAPSSASR